MEVKPTENKIANEAIENITKQIVDEIVGEFHPKSILFIGSFGTNEVAVMMNEEKLKFLSDCEVCIVPNKPISKGLTEKIKSSLSKVTGLELIVAINPVLKAYSYLPIPQFISQKIWKPSIQKFDLKHGSKIIYGENCLQKIPSFEPKDIPLWEGIRLMFNRMAETLKYFSMNSSEVCSEEEQKLVYRISKIIIACQDALLLSIGQYDSSYRIRNNLFQELFPQYFSGLNKELPNFLPLALKATRYKLDPKKGIYMESISKLWFDSVEICDRIFRYVIKKDMGIAFDTYSEFQELYIKHAKVKNEYHRGTISSPIYINTKILFRSHKFLSSKVIRRYGTSWEHLIYSIIPLIFFSLSRSGYIDRGQLGQARITLSIFKKLNQPHKDALVEWEYIKNQTFNLWHNICS